jgi:hypothetical protein
MIRKYKLCSRLFFDFFRNFSKFFENLIRIFRIFLLKILPVLTRKPYTKHIMLRDLLTQKYVQTFLVSDFGYPRACRFRIQKLKIGSRSLLYQLFSKHVGNNRPIFELFRLFSHFWGRGTHTDCLRTNTVKKLFQIQAESSTTTLWNAVGAVRTSTTPNSIVI